MTYTDEQRGKFLYKERAKQLISFEGIKFGTITPTDIDLFIEYKDVLQIFGEFKYCNQDLPYGQKLALERLVDSVAGSGKKAILFVADHYVDDVNEIIYAKDTILRCIRIDRRWIWAKGHNVKLANAIEYTKLCVDYGNETISLTELVNWKNE